jgi:hypothetical protein
MLVKPVGVNTCVPAADGVSVMTLEQVAPAGIERPVNVKVVPSVYPVEVHGVPATKVVELLPPAGNGIENAAPDTAVAAPFANVTVSVAGLVAVTVVKLRLVLTVPDGETGVGVGTATGSEPPPPQAANKAAILVAKTSFCKVFINILVGLKT